MDGREHEERRALVYASPIIPTGPFDLPGAPSAPEPFDLPSTSSTR